MFATRFDFKLKLSDGPARSRSKLWGKCLPHSSKWSMHSLRLHAGPNDVGNGVQVGRCGTPRAQHHAAAAGRRIRTSTWTAPPEEGVLYRRKGRAGVSDVGTHPPEVCEIGKDEVGILCVIQTCRDSIVVCGADHFWEVSV